MSLVGGIVFQGGLADRLAEAGKDGVLIGGDDHHAVGAGIDVRRGDVRQDRAGALAGIAFELVFRDEGFHHREHGLVDGRVDHLAFAGLLPVVQRGERAEGGVEARETVAERDAGARGHAVGFAHHIAQAAHGFTDGRVAGAGGIGAGLAVAGDADHDEAGVDGFQGVVAEAPFLERAGAKILEQEISLRDQLADDVLAFLFAQVRRDAALAARHNGPPERKAFAAPFAQGIALPRRLDLDDVSAHVGEDLSAEGTRDQLAEFDDAQVRQGTRAR